MNKRAWLYIGFVYLLGGSLLVFTISTFRFDYGQLPAFIIFTSLATITQLLKSLAPSHQAYHPALIFAFAGLLLLDPFLFALLIIISHACEWLVERVMSDGEHLRAWYIQPFNISTHIFLGFTARLVFNLINLNSIILSTNLAIVAAICGIATYVLLNHIMVGLAISLARGIPVKESDILNYENLSTDFVMFTMGYIIAVLYKINPWLIFPTLTPLYLIYRALAIPQLKQKANTDPKTGLWNAEYFREALEMELRRANRFRHPLTVVMADLDLLRNINNAYGHLGGDAVLIGIAQILKKNFRDFDIVSRFGGEEFAILLPETKPENAYRHIEAIRIMIEETKFEAPTTGAIIKATMSFGVSGNNGSDLTVKQLLHHADVAVYNAKITGRNRTSIYTEDITDPLVSG